MQDTYGREIDYLRISVTDKCNYRCKYCMPEEGIKKRAHGDVISFEEIAKVVRVANSLGIENIRLTGGEPLVRRGLVELVNLLAQQCALNDLSLTTNGSRLSEMAQPLKEAGLDRVNVSLDSLNRSTFEDLTRRGNLEDVLAGINAAKRVGLRPIKLNSVILRGVNDGEIVDLVEFAADRGLPLRFIGLMPIGHVPNPNLQGLKLDALRRRLTRKWELTPDPGPTGQGPAEYYRISTREGPATVGLIYPQENHFCESCNKIRLTSRGTVRPCLAHDQEVQLGDISTISAEELENSLRKAVKAKPRSHSWGLSKNTTDCGMSAIGG